MSLVVFMLDYGSIMDKQTKLFETTDIEFNRAVLRLDKILYNQQSIYKSRHE